MANEFGSQDSTITFMVSAGLVYEIVAACCSSPQTAEINAHTRAPTLMKWVKLGLVQAGFFVAIAIMLDKKRWPAALGGGLAGALLWWQYQYAKECGLRSAEAGTEN